MVQKLYKDPNTPTGQRLYFIMPDLTSDTPGAPLTGSYDNDPFIPDGVIKIYESQNALVDIVSYTITYDADVLKWLITVPAVYFTQYSTGFIFFSDTRSGPITIDFDVCYPDNYGATFSQVAALATTVNNQDVELALTAYGVPTETSLQTDILAGLANYGAPTETSLQADIAGSLNTYGVPKLSQLNNVSLTQILTQMGTGLTNYGAAKTSDLTGLTTGLATQSSLTTVGNNVLAVKAITDLLTLANIKNQVTISLTDASIPGSLTTISQNILNAKAITDSLSLTAIANAIWEATARTLTSGGESGGITASDVWNYATRSITSTPADGATAAEIAALNNLSTTQVYTQIVNALTNAGLLTQTQMAALLVPIATQASLTTVGNNVSIIKTNTDQLTLANIKTQTSNALTDASIPASLTQANNNIVAIENIVSPLTTSAIAAAIWAYASRSLTSSTSGGATAAEVWAYVNRTITAIPTGSALTTDVTSLNNLSTTQVYTQIINALNAQGLLTQNQMTTLLAGVASQTSLNTANGNISAIKTNTDQLTLVNIKAQDAQALADASIPGNLSLISSNLLSVKSITDILTLSSIANAVWTAVTRSLTVSSGGSGATAQEVWNYNNRSLTEIPTGATLESDLLRIEDLVVDVKSITDLLTLPNISTQVWLNSSRTLTSTGEGGGATADELIQAFQSQLIDGKPWIEFERLLASVVCGDRTKNGSQNTFKSLDGTTDRIIDTTTKNGRTFQKRDGA